MEQASGTLGARYQGGVEVAVYQAPALAGQSLYVARMSDPAVLDRRNKGIQKVSDPSWRSASITKGAPIVGGRFRAAIDSQLTNFRPYRAGLEGLILPARTTDPLANVTNRVGTIVTEMVRIKAAQG